MQLLWALGFFWIVSCAHSSRSQGPTGDRFIEQQKFNTYVLDSDVEIGVSSKKGKPYIDVTLPHSQGCQVWLDQDYPGYIYPEHITNSLDKQEPAIFVLRYDSDCLKSKKVSQGEQRPQAPVQNSIDLYDQVIDSKRQKFRADFESGQIRIAICRYWDCSPLITYQDTVKPTLIYRSEYVPPKLIDLPLADEKEIKKDTLLVEAVYGPPIPACDARIKVMPSLLISMFLPQLLRSQAAETHEFTEDTRHIFRFYKGAVVDQATVSKLARKGEVFCSLRIVEPKHVAAGGDKTQANQIDILPFQSQVFASALAATFYKVDEKDLAGLEYFSRTFEMRSGVTNSGAYLAGGFCSSPHADQPWGRQIRIQDVIDNIPGVSFSTNLTSQQ